jgi:hypothetical protein
MCVISLWKKKPERVLFGRRFDRHFLKLVTSISYKLHQNYGRLMLENWTWCTKMIFMTKNVKSRLKSSQIISLRPPESTQCLQFFFDPATIIPFQVFFSLHILTLTPCIKINMYSLFILSFYVLKWITHLWQSVHTGSEFQDDYHCRT